MELDSTADATALADLVRKGEVKPLELVEAAIARAKKLNPGINAIILPLYERAREQAAQTLPEGPLRGVPTTIINEGHDILGPLPELKPMPYPGRIAYLFANVFIPTVPASFLTFAKYPIYALYELSQPVSGLSTVEDQQIAGLIMKIVGGLIVFGTASVLFFKWAHAEEQREQRHRRGGGGGSVTGPGQSAAEPTVEPA